jgi:hypothetical protein
MLLVRGDPILGAACSSSAIFILGLVRLGVVGAQLRKDRRIGVGLCIVAVVLLPGVVRLDGPAGAADLILFELDLGRILRRRQVGSCGSH